MQDLNNNIKQLDLTGTYKTLYPTTEYTFFSSVYKTLTKKIILWAISVNLRVQVYYVTITELNYKSVIKISSEHSLISRN